MRSTSLLFCPWHAEVRSIGATARSNLAKYLTIASSVSMKAISMVQVRRGTSGHCGRGRHHLRLDPRDTRQPAAASYTDTDCLELPTPFAPAAARRPRAR